MNTEATSRALDFIPKPKEPHVGMWGRLGNRGGLLCWGLAGGVPGLRGSWPVLRLGLLGPIINTKPSIAAP